MKKLILLYFIFITCAGLVSCEKTEIQFGQEYIDNGNTNIALIDTLSIDVSTLYRDSIMTSGSAILLAGTYNDEVFGKITAKSYFLLSPPILADLPANSAYDSLLFLVRPNKLYFGDTTLYNQLFIYQLTDPLSYATGDTHFYSTTNKPVESTPLGSVSTLIYPNITDTVRIRLSDVKGQELFQLYKSRANEMQTTDNFLNYFKGLQLAGGNNMKAVFGFNDSVIMRLHYHEANLFTEKKFIDFNFVNLPYQYNQVSDDRTGTPLESFNSTNNEVSSSSTNHQTYTQLLTGFATKVKFPTIKSLLQIPGFVKILKAELIIRPVKYSYTNNPLPLKVEPVNIDASNTINTSLGAYDANGGFITQTGNLTIDNVYNENTFYTYDVTTFLQTQIITTIDNKNGLTFLPNDYQKTLSRIVIGDQQNTNGKMQLKLNYISINK